MTEFAAPLRDLTAPSVRRLHKQFPLPERQALLNDSLRRLPTNFSEEAKILYAFAEHGRAPDLDDKPAQAIHDLAARDLVITANGLVLGAYPLTLEPAAHRVSINGHRLIAMCKRSCV